MHFHTTGERTMDNTEVDLQSEKPVLNISGDKVALGPLQKSMIPAFVRWENDFAVSMMSGSPLRPISREAIEGQFEQQLKENSKHIEFAIYEQASMQVIGLAELKHIDRTHRIAEYGILIGE